MNTLSIAPQIVMSTLQNMNTKRDTLEKRVIGKQEEFIRKPVNRTNTADTSSNTKTAIPPQKVAQEYTPSIEDQYLPKSLRGNNTNPYSIMNAMSDSVKNPVEISAGIVVTDVTSSIATAVPAATPALPAVTAAAATFTNDTSSAVSTSNSIVETNTTVLDSVPVAEYTSTQKEVTIASPL
jgi:hypothetical protein